MTLESCSVGYMQRTNVNVVLQILRVNLENVG